jgi:hypothetical protein
MVCIVEHTRRLVGEPPGDSRENYRHSKFLSRQARTNRIDSKKGAKCEGCCYPTRLGLVFQIILIGFAAPRSGAQTFTAPPAPPPGSTGNSLVINGNVAVDRLTVNVNFFPGNGVGVTVNSGTGNLTDTTVNLGSSGGVKGLVANGPG